MAQNLNFDNPASYIDGVDWIRDNVLLRNTTKGLVLQLDVAIADGKVTLYMDTRNHYIMGFHGADNIYLLHDDQSGPFKKAVQAVYKDSDPEILDLSVSHRDQGLGTFYRKGNGVVGRIFRKDDLRSTRLLSQYSRTNRIPYAELKLPLSLLVCMISEAARIPMMQRDFKNLYYGHDVLADDAIQSYDDAKFLMTMAARIFPEYPFALGVEKIEKRAAEMNSLLERIGSKSTAAPRGKVLIAEMVSKRVLAWEAPVAQEVKRFRDMCKELNLSDATEISQILSTCKNQSAVRAAKQGVVIPPISL